MSQKYQTPAAPPDWRSLYANLQQPLHLDIGCAKGQFLINMAQQEPGWNFLGIEIREPLVVQANAERNELRLTNLHFLFCNVNNSLRPLLESLPAGVLQRVTIQFPDPWFKKRHQKRRVVQPELVTDLAAYLVSGGMVLIQSDIETVATEMRDRLGAHSAFMKQGEQPWLAANPLAVPTEREQSTLAQGEPVYRAAFVRV
nr:tRNA (guanosine(46)-N7)-methyltransferase TrmB [Oculatella sp. LEGE 06141]